MTKKLEDILNLPNVKKAFEEVDKKEKDKKSKESSNGAVSSKNLDPQTKKNLEKSYAEFDKVAAALPQVKGLGELSDLELDKLAVEAEESYKNLMDLGMNVDSFFSRINFLSPHVIVAYPLRIIQCSALLLCNWRDSEAPGFTSIFFIFQREELSTEM